MTSISSTNKSRELLMAVSAGGICLAMAEILSLIKVFEMPQGGSVTAASMLPIILFALCFGPGYGLVLAFAYSLLQTFIGGYLMSFPQVLLDYTVAFTGLGIAGFFAAKKSVRELESNMLRRLKLIPVWRIVLGTSLAILMRLISSFLAGIVFWAEYAPEGQTVWGYSLAYNASYLIPETLITLVVLFALSSTLLVTKNVPVADTTPRMTKKAWILTVIISLLPVFGQIFLIVWTFDKTSPRSKKIYSAIFLGLIVLAFGVWIGISLAQKAPFVPFQ